MMMKKIFWIFERLSILTIPFFLFLLFSSEFFPNIYIYINKWYIDKNSAIATIISIFASTCITLYLTFPNQPSIKLALKNSYRKLMTFLEVQIFLAFLFVFSLLFDSASVIITSSSICLVLAILWNFIVIIVIIFLSRRSDESFEGTDQKVDGIKKQMDRIEAYVERINRTINK